LKSSQGTSGEGIADVTVFRDVSGTELGLAEVSVQPGPLGQSLFVPVGGPLPTLGVTHLKGGLWITSFQGSGTLKNRICVRTCATEEGACSEWTALEAGWTDTTADEERNTGTVAVPSLFEDDAYYQGGVMLNPTTAVVTASLRARLFGVRP
jgi:hypothetical protein